MFEIVGHQIEVDLTSDQQLMFVESFIDDTLRPESAAIYQQNLNAGNTVETAIFQAIVNEGVNDAIVLVNSHKVEPEISDRFIEMCNTSYSKYKVEE